MIVLQVGPPLKEAAYTWSHSLFDTERKEKAILDNHFHAKASPLHNKNCSKTKDLEILSTYFQSLHVATAIVITSVYYKTHYL